MKGPVRFVRSVRSQSETFRSAKSGKACPAPISNSPVIAALFRTTFGCHPSARMRWKMPVTSSSFATSKG